MPNKTGFMLLYGAEEDIGNDGVYHPIQNDGVYF